MGLQLFRREALDEMLPLQVSEAGRSVEDVRSGMVGALSSSKVDAWHVDVTSVVIATPAWTASDHSLLVLPWQLIDFRRVTRKSAIPMPSVSGCRR